MHVAQQENAYAHEFYRRRDPCASPLWKLMDGHLAEFERAYPQRYEQKYGFWRPVITLAAERFLKCGDLREGFARVHCDGCGHDLFVSFSCKNFAARCKI